MTFVLLDAHLSHLITELTHETVSNADLINNV